MSRFRAHPATKFKAYTDTARRSAIIRQSCWAGWRRMRCDPTATTTTSPIVARTPRKEWEDGETFHKQLRFVTLVRLNWCDDGTLPGAILSQHRGGKLFLDAA